MSIILLCSLSPPKLCNDPTLRVVSFQRSFTEGRVIFGCGKEGLEKKLSLQEAFGLLQNLPSESSDSLTDDSSDEAVPANYMMEFLLDS
ncbi:hypothetical protein TNCV_2590751 [Trichonephila clavipes]|nr:hypothetical protein TNCV_2590751 [Trichonephila clavipes]